MLDLKKITGFCHNRIWDRLSKTVPVPYRNTAVQRVFSRVFLACISYPTLLGFKIEIRDARHSFPTPCVLPKVLGELNTYLHHILPCPDIIVFKCFFIFKEEQVKFNYTTAYSSFVRSP